MRNKVRELQRDLYRAAKTNPGRCFHSLYDKVYRNDVLWEAWKRVKANGGVAGNDGETIEGIVDRGEVEYLKELQSELKERRYRAKSIRRVYIPKPDGRLRPLGIPRIRCRIVQGAVKLVIEPILEAHFHESSFGYRPKRSAKEASNRIRKYMNFGYNWIINVDLSSYLETSSYCAPFHERLSKRVAWIPNTLIYKPFRFPQRTWTAERSPCFTRCNTVCRETPRSRVASTIGT
jgi:RNA-directed DNA polymerase